MRGGQNQQAEERQGEVDPQLVDRLEALASPNRLRLLALLEEPTSVAEIELPTSPAQSEVRGTMTQQGVRHHLDKLRKAGLVETHTSKGQGRRLHEYTMDPRGLYELAEVMRAEVAGRSRGLREEQPPRWDAEGSASPRVRVLHGAEIGRPFPLSADRRREGRGWILGRGERVDVRLDWDPEVERQTGEIEPQGGGFRLIDLRATRHRLSLEGEVMEPGEMRELTDGDVIGAGRSLLRFET